MTLATKIALAVAGVVGGGLVARAVVRPVRVSNPRLRSSRRAVSVGRSAGAGTQDWWTGRNERRRQKHLRMMSAKG